MMKKLKLLSEMSDKEKEEILERCLSDLPDEEPNFKELAKVLSKTFKQELENLEKTLEKDNQLRSIILKDLSDEEITSMIGE